jgi:cytochrome c-type biogenesis protein CcmH
VRPLRRVRRGGRAAGRRTLPCSAGLPALIFAAALGLVLPAGGAAQAGAATPESGAGGAQASPAAAARSDSEAGGLTGAALDDQAAKVAAELRCPVCRGQSILESSATLSKEIKAEIRRRLAAGESPDSVKAYFVGRYGEWILLKPPTHGFSLLVYILPGVLLLGGLGVAALFVRSRSARPVASSEEPADQAPESGEPGRGREGGAPADGLSEEERHWLEDALREE